jgi:hypothetical protein
VVSEAPACASPPSCRPEHRPAFPHRSAAPDVARHPVRRLDFATINAFYGRFQEAEEALAAVSWQGVPAFIEAQEHVARATIAYARGSLSGGLDHAISAAQLASVDSRFPGAQRSELALRTSRNLGLALSGRATESTEEELRVAFRRLPLLGQINAAWGLAVIAGRKGDTAQQQEMRAFIETRAPHFAPVLRSIDSAGEYQVT